MLINEAKDRLISLVSERKIQRKFNPSPKHKKEKKVSLSTLNWAMNKYLSKPKQTKKVFLNSSNKSKSCNSSIYEKK